MYDASAIAHVRMGHFAQITPSAKEAFAMSMEIYLLTDEAVLTTQAWQVAVDALEFDIRFVDEQSLQTNEIRLRAECKGKPVLIELERTSLARVRGIFPDVAFPDRVSCVHALYWSKTLEVGLAAYQAAAAYLGLVKGLMIDTEESKLKTRDGAIELARKMSAEMPMLEAAMADILARMAPPRS